MLMLQTINHHLLLSSNFPFSISHPHKTLNPLTSLTSLRLLKPNPWPATRALEPRLSISAVSLEEEEGPVELPPSSSTSSIFATTDDPSNLQVATSVLLTGAITVFLFRSIRRRAKRAKELKFRSSGVNKSLKEEAVDNLKAMQSVSIEAKPPPSPIQAFLGGIAAGVIALILYKFTTTIEAALNRQTISDTLTVRQITITVRTIINGVCYLATFVFGINSIGLLLYSGQLLINSIMGVSTEESNQTNGEEKVESLNSEAMVPKEDRKLNTRDTDQRSDDKP